MRYKLEQNAVAVCLVFSAACFVAGAVLQHTGRALDAATTWKADR